MGDLVSVLFFLYLGNFYLFGGFAVVFGVGHLFLTGN